MRNYKCARIAPEQIHLNFYSMGQQTRRYRKKGFEFGKGVLGKLENVHSAIASTILGKMAFARFGKLTQRKKGSE